MSGVVGTDGRGHRPLLSGTESFSSPRWSPSGDRLAYVASAGERGPELYVRWMDTGQTALLSNLPADPGDIAWSPDGKQIAFTMFAKTAGTRAGDAAGNARRCGMGATGDLHRQTVLPDGRARIY